MYKFLSACSYIIDAGYYHIAVYSALVTFFTYWDPFQISLEIRQDPLILAVNIDRASYCCGIWEFLPKREAEMTLATQSVLMVKIKESDVIEIQR